MYISVYFSKNLSTFDFAIRMDSFGIIQMKILCDFLRFFFYSLRFYSKQYLTIIMKPIIEPVSGPLGWKKLIAKEKYLNCCIHFFLVTVVCICINCRPKQHSWNIFMENAAFLSSINIQNVLVAPVECFILKNCTLNTFKIWFFNWIRNFGNHYRVNYDVNHQKLISSHYFHNSPQSNHYLYSHVQSTYVHTQQ